MPTVQILFLEYCPRVVLITSTRQLGRAAKKILHFELQIYQVKSYCLMITFDSNHVNVSKIKSFRGS